MKGNHKQNQSQEVTGVTSSLNVRQRDMKSRQASEDHRKDVAGFYDRFTDGPLGDVAFYQSRVFHETRVLELGCGTGRVLVHLAESAQFVFGLDHSAAMLALCQKKLASAGIDAGRADVEIADITDFDLTGRMPKFDLIIAPFRVMQNLETDGQIAGMMSSIRRHLAKNGEAILNVFNPFGGPCEIKALWDARDGAQPTWSKTDGEETVTLTDVCTRHRDDPLTVFPELTYRRYDVDGRKLGEAGFTFAMRVWYPSDLLTMIASHGFTVYKKFGGYQGEAWQEGSELVISFKHRKPEAEPDEAGNA